MFERFTDRARRVVVLAQEESRLLNHNYIGTEHILLGLIHEGEGVAARALEGLDVSLEAVRREVEEIIGEGAASPRGHIPFTPRAKKVLELALREALQLGHNYIGTEHILLGLLREGEGVAAQVLVKLGADLGRVRQEVVQLLSGYPGGDPPRLEERPIGATGRQLHLRVAAGRITLTVDDPELSDLPELSLTMVVRLPDDPPVDSRALYAAVRDVVRQLDHRLAELESDIVFDESSTGPPSAPGDEPAGEG
jgi:ATP-dependent Clp protease ATP-binding subunit ClpA